MYYSLPTGSALLKKLYFGSNNIIIYIIIPGEAETVILGDNYDL